MGTEAMMAAAEGDDGGLNFGIDSAIFCYKMATCTPES
jgi:hypothetical protein